MGQIVSNQAVIRRTEHRQPLELREFLQRGGGLSFLHTSLLLQTPRSPVEDRELSTDCLHNHYYRKRSRRSVASGAGLVFPNNRNATGYRPDGRSYTSAFFAPQRFR